MDNLFFCFVLFRDTSSTLQWKNAYVVPPDVNFYRVPRGGFTLFHEVNVYVVAMNALGQAISNVLVLDPMKTG